MEIVEYDTFGQFGKSTWNYHSDDCNYIMTLNGSNKFHFVVEHKSRDIQFDRVALYI